MTLSAWHVGKFANALLPALGESFADDPEGAVAALVGAVGEYYAESCGEPRYEWLPCEAEECECVCRLFVEMVAKRDVNWTRATALIVRRVFRC